MRMLCLNSFPGTIFLVKLLMDERELDLLCNDTQGDVQFTRWTEIVE